MFDTTKLLHDHGIIDVIRILAANRESGRLEIKAGSTEGAISFRAGQLVDARVGHLTGFPAVNAVASMRGARFSFDPSVAPPAVSSITPNERIVLKQFFGIETADLNEHESQEYPNIEELNSAAEEEVTLETAAIPSDVLHRATPYMLSKKFLYRGGLILAALFIPIAVATVALRNEFRERESGAQVTTTVQSPSAPPAESPSVAVAKSPSTAVATSPSVPVAEQVKQNDQVTSVAQEPTTQNLNGKWNIVNTVQQTSYRSFQDMKIGFVLSINQAGKQFTGKGEKVSENGRSLPGASRTPIEVKGSIEGDRIEATFFEEGTLRKTNGRFVWRIDKAGALTGTFVTTAARSRGKSAAQREL